LTTLTHLHLLLSVVAALVFCAIAIIRRWLSVTGGAAAAFIAILILCAGGWPLALPMIIFFICGSLLSKLPSSAIIKDVKAKRPRDHIQVFCNGGIAAACAVAYLFLQWPAFVVAYFVSIAISMCDTVSSETGNYFKGKVFDLVSGKTVEKGISGGVSVAGTIFGFAGSLLIAILYAILYEDNTIIIFQIATAGFAGMLLDSIIGSIWQGKYRDENGNLTEDHQSRTILVKGRAWLNNDAVNIISNAFITLIMLCMHWIH
jgi:uncharacterized protein (TIGR00297 family)